MDDLRDFLVRVDARKRALGISDGPEETEALRNKGENRTDEKRALLRRARQRAQEAGHTPGVVSHY